MTLLGPNGQPMQTYRKAQAPKLGPAFGDWAGRDSTLNQMPGAAMLSFDLSQLNLSDYRAMRDHPQINASLCVLAFMMHGLDWKIEGPNKKANTMIEDNLRETWTRLIRAMSQSYWAGYSPTVIEWENDTENGQVVISKFKDLVPEDCQVNWKTVEGFAEPGHVPPKFKIYNGIRHRGFGGQLDQNTNLMSSNTRYIPPENTIWYPLLMENGDYYGRKLLRPAFASWYFSILIHLFANRYYERFGEPTPIGRAPLSEMIETGDPGQPMISGKAAMESILQNLRNRGVVVLPNDRVPVGQTSEWEYDIEYLESQMRGADFERYLARLDEEMSLGIFTPVLMFRSGSVGSYNLGVQQAQCVAPETPILCADLVWRKAGDLTVGQEIVAFDDQPDFNGHGANGRYYRTAVIEANEPATKPSMRITTDIGVPVTASVDHPWLVWRRRNRKEHGNANKGLMWVETKDLEVGDQIAHLARPWEREESRDAGWLAGMFDGEGCLSMNLSNRGALSHGVELSIAQNEGPVLDKLKKVMSEQGIVYGETNKVKNCKSLRIGGGFVGAIEFLGRVQPERLVAKAKQTWEGRGVRNGQSFELATVESIEFIGDNPVASIQTSTGTFITAGYLSHNTFMWMLNALAGDLKEYIDRYVVRPLRDFNFGPKAGKVEWKFRKMGTENVEMVRAIMQSLISGNKASVDLDELGVLAGLSLTEIKEVAAPPPAPGQVDPVTGNDVRPRQRPGVPGPRGVGQPRATGRQISNRIRSQVENAFRRGEFGSGFNASLGYERRFEDSLIAEGYSSEEAGALTGEFYRRVNMWMADAVSLGTNEYSGAQDFMSMFERVIDSEVDRIAEPT